eukprot:2824322-Alexandrium_andersonii.AAC.1
MPAGTSASNRPGGWSRTPPPSVGRSGWEQVGCGRRSGPRGLPPGTYRSRGGQVQDRRRAQSGL